MCQCVSTSIVGLKQHLGDATGRAEIASVLPKLRVL